VTKVGHLERNALQTSDVIMATKLRMLDGVRIYRIRGSLGSGCQSQQSTDFSEEYITTIFMVEE
jgi:hypothetical protein